ncbi:MAG TPA: hypothetical protein VLD67_09230 [Vicinamibacterales bacterium]|nr:hypothetical protein [Vicinamibacterales bacterium]
MRISLLTGVFVLAVAVQGTSQLPTGPIPANPKEAAALATFTARVDDYVKLHRDLEGPVPTVRVSSDPAEIRAAMTALADKIREARPHAKQGDFFTADIVTLFRRLIREGCGGQYKKLLEAVRDEAPPMATPEVNGRWPDEAPMTMMPPGVLCNLPQLPDELEYRFVSRDLVLRDMHANLIVDVLVRAIPPGTWE